MDQIPFYQVDAFTDKPFRGNPAAICLMSTRLGDEIYLDISSEINLSETAFAEEESEGVYRLRWFTPKREVPLCGHATLALAHTVFNELSYGGPALIFKTPSGELYAYRGQAGVLMDFPRNDPEPVEPIDGILEALGVGEYVDFQYSYSNQKLLIEVMDEDAVKALSPDFRGLLSVENTLGWRGIIVTSKSRNYDFVSRYFAPWMGVDEDPVTGSAHTVLAPYWAAKLGKTELNAYQLSKRGGSISLELGERVRMSGICVTIMRGFLDLGSQ